MIYYDVIKYYVSDRNEIGTGVYFATNAEYSVRDRFAKPNNYGEKFIIMARVVTGDSCRGSTGIKSAPYKKDSEYEQYDSVVDNMSNPEQIVVFHDSAAYPEYIIRFKASQ